MQKPGAAGRQGRRSKAGTGLQQAAFRGASGKRYFGAKDWYKKTTDKQNILNKNEQKLVDIIVTSFNSIASGANWI